MKKTIKTSLFARLVLSIIVSFILILQYGVRLRKALWHVRSELYLSDKKIIHCINYESISSFYNNCFFSLTHMAIIIKSDEHFHNFQFKKVVIDCIVYIALI